jgi:hypothetical protein
MVFASLTYLDSLNMYIALCSYKALTELSEKSWFLQSHDCTYLSRFWTISGLPQQ